MDIDKETFIKRSKRKAEKHHKRFIKGNLESAKYLIANNPLFSKDKPSDLIKRSLKRAVFLHAVANENGFNNWIGLIKTDVD